MFFVSILVLGRVDNSVLLCVLMYVGYPRHLGQIAQLMTSSDTPISKESYVTYN